MEYIDGHEELPWIPKRADRASTGGLPRNRNAETRSTGTKRSRKSPARPRVRKSRRIADSGDEKDQEENEKEGEKKTRRGAGGGGSRRGAGRRRTATDEEPEDRSEEPPRRAPPRDERATPGLAGANRGAKRKRRNGRLDIPRSPSGEASSSTADTESHKRARIEKDEYGSQFSSSDDDDDVELTPAQKLELLQKKGGVKLERLLKKPILGEPGERNWHGSRARQIFAAHAAHPTDQLGPDERGMIGPQKIRKGDGRGHFIQAGGNNRPHGMKEPPAEYKALCEQLKTMTEDRNAASLYEAATGKNLKRDASSFTDQELARMILNHRGADHSALERSQLTEHLSKLVAIFDISEAARAFESEDPGTEAADQEEAAGEDGEADRAATEAEAAGESASTEEEEGEDRREEDEGDHVATEANEGEAAGDGKEKEILRSEEGEDAKPTLSPYDVSLLIKAGLLHVARGQATLQQMFYQGRGGADSIFLGAPSEEKLGSGKGGAARLRNPKRFPEALERQMAIFPSNKREFKAALNAMASGSTMKIPDLSDADRAKARALRAREQQANVKALITKIKSSTIPNPEKAPTAFLEYNDKKRGELWRLHKEIERLKEAHGDDPAMLAKIKGAAKAWQTKQNAYNRAAGVGPSTAKPGPPRGGDRRSMRLRKPGSTAARDRTRARAHSAL